MSGDDELDAGWDDESEASPGEKTPAAPRVGAGGARTTAAPETARFNPDRATLPPPMPEQEYIEKILATDDHGVESAKPKRGRLNTLIDTDPLQYDSPDAHQRPTRPPASAAAAGSIDDGFLDLRLDEELARRSSAPAPEPVIPRPPAAPSKVTPEVAMRPPEPDPLDELPIDAVLDSMSPESLRPSPSPPSARPKAPAPPVVAPPPKPRKTYDSSPSIEVVELTTRPVSQGQRPGGGRATAPPLPSAASAPPVPRRTPLGTPAATAPPLPNKTPLGTPALSRPLPASSGATKKPPAPPMSKTPLRVAAVKVAAEAEKPEKKGKGSGRPPAPPRSATPASGTRASPPSGSKAVAPPKRASKPPERRASDGLVERPTRAIRTPGQVVAVGQESASEKALLKVAERFEAGDYGRALMLAEQVLELDPNAEELLHYAELCREKLRQTYLERIGTGRTILRVSVTDEKLRERSLDPRLAFLLSLLDGASSVDDVVDMSTMPPLEAVRALHELLVEGVIEVVERLRKAP